jgi:hypothetical protein
MDQGGVLDRIEQLACPADRLRPRHPARVERHVDELDAVCFAGLLFQRPAPELAAAAQVHDGPDAVAGGPGDIARQGLRRAPELVADLMAVRIDEPEKPMIGQEHAEPGAQPLPLGRERLTPALDAPLPAIILAGEREKTAGTR